MFAANSFSGDGAPLWVCGLVLLTAIVGGFLFIRWDDRGRARELARSNALFFQSMEHRTEMARSALAADMALAEMARTRRRWERSRPIGFHSRYQPRRKATA